MTYAEFFYEIKNKFMGTDVSDIHEHLAFQFDIEDPECGGIFYVEVKEGQLFVEPYQYYDRDAKFISDPDTFMKMAEGKMDPVAAFTVQKLKVEGNIDKALRLKEIIDMKKKQEKEAKKAAAKTAKTEAKVTAKATKTAAKATKTTAKAAKSTKTATKTATKTTKSTKKTESSNQ